MKDKIFAVLQRVGRSFMLPIAILPVAGLLLGIGGSFTNSTMLETYHLTSVLGPGTVGNAILTVMNDAGNIVFGNLPIIFAIGVAIGMAKKEKEVAALAAAIAFLIMHASIGAMITINGGVEKMLDGATTSVCGITSLQMGVFGGMIVGLGVASLHNRFYKIQLPQVLSFFGGTRFVPIISGLVYTAVGILMYFVWPFVQQGIYAVGDVVQASGYAGTWVYGLMERLLIPFGLHHVFYLPFWQTSVGGTFEVAGQMVEGAQNAFFAELGAQNTITHFNVAATRFMSGKFPLMIFGLPGAALAMYRCALPEKRKEVGGLLLSAALTSMLTGITEPIEFTFLFVAPALYGIHCVFAGLAYMLMHICGVGVGMTFSGGLIDLTLFGILPGNKMTSWVWVPIVGIGYFIVYYFLFSFLIKKFDLKTPGRDADEEVKLYRRSDYNAKKESMGDETSMKITQGLGGKANISDVDCCATRLRCTVHNSELVNDGILKATGASGVVHKGNGVQIIYGPHVTVIKSNLEDYLETAPNELYTAEANDAAEAAEAEKPVDEAPKKVVKTITIYSPADGKADDLSTTPDEAFASGMMGSGAVVTPVGDTIYAPFDGTIGFIFDTKHAIGFIGDDGLNLLVHVGIDTVKLGGQGFETLVTMGQKVKKGDPLLKIDLDYLKANAPSIATPVLCTDVDEDKIDVRLVKAGDIKAGEPLFEVDFFE